MGACRPRTDTHPHSVDTEPILMPAKSNQPLLSTHQLLEFLFLMTEPAFETRETSPCAAALRGDVNHLYCSELLICHNVVNQC